MITLLLTIVFFIILGICSACFTYFADFCIEENNIFGFWGKLLNETASKYPKYIYFLKPLGYCIYCFNFWLSLFIYLSFSVYLKYDLYFSILMFIPFISSSTFFLFKTEKYFD